MGWRMSESLSEMSRLLTEQIALLEQTQTELNIYLGIVAIGQILSGVACFIQLIRAHSKEDSDTESVSK